MSYKFFQADLINLLSHYVHFRSYEFIRSRKLIFILILSQAIYLSRDFFTFRTTSKFEIVTTSIIFAFVNNISYFVYKSWIDESFNVHLRNSSVKTKLPLFFLTHCVLCWSLSMDYCVQVSMIYLHGLSIII
jgi:hypothetical protein